MKKYLNQALAFAVYGLCAGVFYREFTKLNGFTGQTMLSMAHPHILMLGLLGMLLVALFVKVLDIAENKLMKTANCSLHAGITLASAMMFVRGILEVRGSEITASVSGMISGIAGLGHIATALGIILFLLAFRKAAEP